MKIELTEEEIAARLREAQSTASTDGYAQNGAGAHKYAAVLVPLLRQDGEWHLLYTRRTEHVDPIPEVVERLAVLWPSDRERRTVTWPLALRIGRPRRPPPKPVTTSEARSP